MFYIKHVNLEMKFILHDLRQQLLETCCDHDVRDCESKDHSCALCGTNRDKHVYALQV
jgi:hypothetical protein